MCNSPVLQTFLVTLCQSTVIFGVFLKFLEQQVLVQEVNSGHKLKTHDTSEKIERASAFTRVIFRASYSPNLSFLTVFFMRN